MLVNSLLILILRRIFCMMMNASTEHPLSPRGRSRLVLHAKDREAHHMLRGAQRTVPQPAAVRKGKVDHNHHGPAAAAHQRSVPALADAGMIRHRVRSRSSTWPGLTPQARESRTKAMLPLSSCPGKSITLLAAFRSRGLARLRFNRSMLIMASPETATCKRAIRL